MKLEYDLLNIEMIEDLRDTLLAFSLEDGETLSLDLQQVNKIDLAAIQLFMSLQKTLLSQNKKLELKNCAQGVADAFALCGCTTLLGVCDG